MSRPGPHVRDIALLFCGVIACATSVIFIKMSTVHPALVPAYRLAIAAAIMLPAFRREARRHPGWLTPRRLRGVLAGGALLALHFVTWTAGARMTTAMNGSLLVNLAPVVMPFLLWFQLGERLNRRELGGTILSLAGIVWLAVGDFRFDRGHFAGDVVCFVSMVLFALYLAAARAARDIPGLWLYVVPLYAVAAVFSLAMAIPVAPVLDVYPAREYLWIALLALVPTVAGHTLLNRSMRRLRGQVVTLASSMQFVFSGTLAALFLGETTRPAVYPAAALVAAGALVVVLATPDAKENEVASDREAA